MKCQVTPSQGLTLSRVKALFKHFQDAFQAFHAPFHCGKLHILINIHIYPKLLFGFHILNKMHHKHKVYILNVTVSKILKITSVNQLCCVVTLKGIDLICGTNMMYSKVCTLTVATKAELHKHRVKMVTNVHYMISGFTNVYKHWVPMDTSFTYPNYKPCLSEYFLHCTSYTATGVIMSILK